MLSQTLTGHSPWRSRILCAPDGSQQEVAFTLMRSDWCDMAKKKNRARKTQFVVRRSSAPVSKVRDLKNKTQFEQVVIDSDKPAIIDFWAEWCAPCKATAPAFAAAAERYGDQVNFCKVNTEKNRTVAESFHIRSIPTLILMHQGEVVDIHTGASNQAAIERMAKKLIAKARPATEDASEADTSAPPSGLFGKLKGVFGRSAEPASAE